RGARAHGAAPGRHRAGGSGLRYHPGAVRRATATRACCALGVATDLEDRLRSMAVVVTASATYLYCAVQSARDPLRGAAPRLPRGLPGSGPPRALNAGGGVWLVVAAAPLDRYAADAIDARLADL